MENVKYVNTDHLTILVAKDYVKLMLFNNRRSPYGYNKRDLISSLFGIKHKELTYKYVENEVNKVYSKFDKKEIKELLKKFKKEI